MGVIHHHGQVHGSHRLYNLIYDTRSYFIFTLHLLKRRWRSQGSVYYYREVGIVVSDWPIGEEDFQLSQLRPFHTTYSDFHHVGPNRPYMRPAYFALTIQETKSRNKSWNSRSCQSCAQPLSVISTIPSYIYQHLAPQRRGKSWLRM